jgi:hypothetical protein
MYTLLTNLLWYIAYIYSFFKSFNFGEMVRWYFYGDEDDLLIYVFEEGKMIPWRFSKDKNSLCYVILKIHDRNKILLFNNRYILIEKYGFLKDLVERKMGKFSHYMEVFNTKTSEDVLDVFNNYSDSGNTFFSDITNYSIKAKDLYDFRNNRFLLQPGDKLQVVKMDLDTIEYSYDDSLDQETTL